MNACNPCLWRIYPRTPAGAILSRFSGDVVGLEGALVSLISWFVLPALEVVYATVLMFWFSVWLGLIGLLVFPIILWGPRLFAARALVLGYEKRRSEAELLNVVQENVGAQAVVKAFGLERHARDRFARAARAGRTSPSDSTSFRCSSNDPLPREATSSIC